MEVCVSSNSVSWRPDFEGDSKQIRKTPGEKSDAIMQRATLGINPRSERPTLCHHLETTLPRISFDSPFMSGTHLTASSSSNQVSNFHLIINNALDEYKKRTKKDLRVHPLATELQSCSTPSAILSILHRQVQSLDQSRRRDDRWTRCLDPTVNVLFNLSTTLGQGVGLVCFRT